MNWCQNRMMATRRKYSSYGDFSFVVFRRIGKNNQEYQTMFAVEDDVAIVCGSPPLKEVSA